VVNLPELLPLPATVTFAIGQTEISLPLVLNNDQELGTYREVLISASAAGLETVTQRLVVQNDDTLVVYRGQALVHEAGYGQAGRRKIGLYVIVGGEPGHLSILGIIEYSQKDREKQASLPDLAGGLQVAGPLLRGHAFFFSEGPTTNDRATWMVSSSSDRPLDRLSLAGQYLAYGNDTPPGRLGAGPLSLRPDHGITRKALADNLTSDQIIALLLAGPLSDYSLR
jgi:hypothetical protein